MSMIVFYKKSDGSVLSYVSYNEKDEEENLIKPSLEKCAENHGLSIDDIDVKEFTKENPAREDFKDNVNDLEKTDIKEIR